MNQLAAVQQTIRCGCRVLTYSEADVFQLLDGAVPVCCTGASLLALKVAASKGLPGEAPRVHPSSHCPIECIY